MFPEEVILMAVYQHLTSLKHQNGEKQRPGEKIKDICDPIWEKGTKCARNFTKCCLKRLLEL